MVEPSDSISASTPISSQYEDSHFSQESIIYQLEMANAMESIIDLMNEIQQQEKQNAQETGQPNSPLTPF
ncbi:MAG: hypothetical protein QNJ27_04950 [Simkaniaceae bacterium]|nr:hypothetical protein [Simkaniaceae bacterium]